MKVETIRFVARDEDEAYFIRAVHQLAAGCLLLGAREHALTALLDVVSRAVGERQEREAVLELFDEAGDHITRKADRQLPQRIGPSS